MSDKQGKEKPGSLYNLSHADATALFRKVPVWHYVMQTNPSTEATEETFSGTVFIKYDGTIIASVSKSDEALDELASTPEGIEALKRGEGVEQYIMLHFLTGRSIMPKETFGSDPIPAHYARITAAPGNPCTNSMIELYFVQNKFALGPEHNIPRDIFSTVSENYRAGTGHMALETIVGIVQKAARR